MGVDDSNLAEIKRYTGSTNIFPTILSISNDEWYNITIKLTDYQQKIFVKCDNSDFVTTTNGEMSFDISEKHNSFVFNKEHKTQNAYIKNLKIMVPTKEDDNNG